MESFVYEYEFLLVNWCKLDSTENQLKYIKA